MVVIRKQSLWFFSKRAFKKRNIRQVSIDLSSPILFISNMKIILQLALNPNSKIHTNFGVSFIYLLPKNPKMVMHRSCSTECSKFGFFYLFISPSLVTCLSRDTMTMLLYSLMFPRRLCFFFFFSQNKLLSEARK